MIGGGAALVVALLVRRSIPVGAIIEGLLHPSPPPRSGHEAKEAYGRYFPSGARFG